MELHWDILDKKRRALLPHLSSWKKEGLYLAGGTALALQLGHRTSQDFDFYSPNPFDSLKLAGLIRPSRGKFRVTSQKVGNLFGMIHDVQVSVFHYPYPLLKPLVQTEHLALVSIEDIAAMKIIAVVQRGTRRDFIDLYFLAKRIPLHNLLRLAGEKYKSFDTYNGLRGLIYFQDAEQEGLREGVRLTSPEPWTNVKGFFRRAVEAELRRLS